MRRTLAESSSEWMDRQEVQKPVSIAEELKKLQLEVEELKEIERANEETDKQLGMLVSTAQQVTRKLLMSNNIRSLSNSLVRDACLRKHNEPPTSSQQRQAQELEGLLNEYRSQFSEPPSQFSEPPSQFSEPSSHQNLRNNLERFREEPNSQSRDISCAASLIASLFWCPLFANAVSTSEMDTEMKVLQWICQNITKVPKNKNVESANQSGSQIAWNFNSLFTSDQNFRPERCFQRLTNLNVNLQFISQSDVEKLLKLKISYTGLCQKGHVLRKDVEEYCCVVLQVPAPPSIHEIEYVSLEMLYKSQIISLDRFYNAKRNLEKVCTSCVIPNIRGRLEMEITFPKMLIFVLDYENEQMINAETPITFPEELYPETGGDRYKTGGARYKVRCATYIKTGPSIKQKPTSLVMLNPSKNLWMPINRSKEQIKMNTQDRTQVLMYQPELGRLKVLYYEEK